MINEVKLYDVLSEAPAEGISLIDSVKKLREVEGTSAKDIEEICLMLVTGRCNFVATKPILGLAGNISHYWIKPGHKRPEEEPEPEEPEPEEPKAAVPELTKREKCRKAMEKYQHVWKKLGYTPADIISQAEKHVGKPFSDWGENSEHWDTLTSNIYSNKPYFGLLTGIDTPNKPIEDIKAEMDVIEKRNKEYWEKRVQTPCSKCKGLPCSCD